MAGGALDEELEDAAAAAADDVDGLARTLAIPGTSGPKKDFKANSRWALVIDVFRSCASRDSRIAWFIRIAEASRCGWKEQVSLWAPAPEADR